VNDSAKAALLRLSLRDVVTFDLSFLGTNVGLLNWEARSHYRKRSSLDDYVWR
jgi:hypothetical protein